MLQINYEVIESLEEVRQKRQKKYNQWVVEDLLGLGERVKKVIFGRLKLEDL